MSGSARRNDESTHVDALNQEVGRNVHAAMVRHGVKGIEIAKLLELEPQSLSARLHGKTPFKAHELRMIAERLAIEPGEFFGGVAANAHNPRYDDLRIVRHTGQMSLPLDNAPWEPKIVDGELVIDLREFALP